MQDDWVMRLEVRSPDGRVSFVRGINLGDAIGEGFIVPAISTYELVGTPRAFEAVVESLKKRHAQPEKLEEAAKVLARAMSDEIEDWAGWHGERRQDRQSAKVGARIDGRPGDRLSDEA